MSVGCASREATFFFMSAENHENTVLPRSDAVQAVQQALRDGYAL